MVESVELYLFRSGFGFLIFELNMVKAANLDEIADFTYFLKHDTDYSCRIQSVLKDPHPSFVENYERKRDGLLSCLRKSGFPIDCDGLVSLERTNDGHLESAGCKVNVIYEQVLNMVFGEEKFTGNLTGNQSFVFSYCFVEKVDDRELVNEQLFRLRRGVRAQYLPAPDDVSESSNEVLRTYENVHLGIAIEGCAVIVEDVGNPFFQQFTERVKNRYFIIYLLALHNRMALLNYRHKVEILIPDAFDRMHITKELVHRIRELRNQMVGFYNNAYFIQISNSTTFEKMYEKLLEVLYVEKLLSEIQTKTIELDGLVDIHLERRSNNLIYLITVIGFVFAPLAIIAEVLGINIRHMGNPAQGFYFSWQFAVLMLSMCVVLSGLFVLILLLRRKGGRKSKMR